MSRYGDYGGGGERWNAERFNRERGGRQVVERDRFEEHERFAPPRAGGREAPIEDFHSPPRVARGERFEERDRFFEEERFGPPARRPVGRQQRYYEEEDIDSFDDSPNRGLEARGPRGYEARRNPPRPGIIRRQSSLDTFDRRPLPRYPREPPEIIAMPPPGRRRRSPPRYERDFEEIRIAEPDFYGDEEFRGYKEREVSTVRRRRGAELEFEDRENLEVEEEEPFPRKGRTRMPAKLVNKRAIIELGYPFEEEGEMVIILKALDKERIDQVINVSKEMNRSATRTTYMIEAPPPPPEEVIERREIVIPEIVAQGPSSEVPRSVREWDVMGGAIPGGHLEHGGGHSEHGAKSTHGGKSTHGAKSAHGGKSSHTGKSHHGGGKSAHGGHSTKGDHSVKGGHSSKGAHSMKGGHAAKGGHSEGGSASESESSSSSSSSPSEPSVIIEKRSIRSKSRHRSKSVGHGELIEEVGESNAMHNGPLALVLPHREKERNSSRDERSIKAEIRALEAEKRKLKMEREIEKEHRKGSKYDEVIVERREKDVKVEKDRKGPDSRVVKALLATLT